MRLLKEKGGSFQFREDKWSADLGKRKIHHIIVPDFIVQLGYL
jgi:hypothetical protein